MVKKQPLEVFSKTEPEPGASFDLEAGHVRPIGLGLRDGEILALDTIAGGYGLSRGSLMRIVLRLFIRSWEAGQVDLSQYVAIPDTPKNKAILPK
jgi:ABC-type sugar transport system ATPase subunit